MPVAIRALGPGSQSPRPSMSSSPGRPGYRDRGAGGNVDPAVFAARAVQPIAQRKQAREREKEIAGAGRSLVGAQGACTNIPPVGRGEAPPAGEEKQRFHLGAPPTRRERLGEEETACFQGGRTLRASEHGDGKHAPLPQKFLPPPPSPPRRALSTKPRGAQQSRCVLLAPFGFALEARPAKGHENRGARAGGVEEGWREIGEMRINVRDGIRAHQGTGRMSMRNFGDGGRGL